MSAFLPDIIHPVMLLPSGNLIKCHEEVLSLQSILRCDLIKRFDNFPPCVCVYVCFSHQPIGPQPYPVIYGVANPVRGLLNRKTPEEHLQNFNESMTTKTKQNNKMTKRKE